MKQRSFFSLIHGMMSLVKGKTYLIVLAVLVGTLGFLSAMGITFFAALGILKLIGLDTRLSYGWIIALLLICGFSRGFLRYGEQYLNHYMAFTLLADVRDQVFCALSRQGDKVLDDRNRGEVLSMLQSDTESLEVFYAHTITPFFIALCTEAVVLVLFGILIHCSFSLLALGLYLIIGAFIPMFFYLINRKMGVSYRKELSGNENLYLNAAYGMREILSFNHQDMVAKEITDSTRKMNRLSRKLNDLSLTSSCLVNFLILIGNLVILLLGAYLFQKGMILGPKMILAYMMLATSFGPVIALSNLPGNLTMSFASANRILDLRDRKSRVQEGNSSFSFESLAIKDVSFGYEKNEILSHVSFTLKRGEIIGIQGKSGSGKTTLLKLLLHFEEAQKGEILYNGKPVQEFSRESLAKNVTLFSQSTYLFKNTLAYNLRIAKPDASDQELQAACEKAGILEKIHSLKNGFDTEVKDLADNFSTGEKQRIGLARIFLSDSRLILLDEATSNVDGYNENLILSQLCKEREDKAVILISHRPSTLSICDRIYHLEGGTLCQN